MCGWTLPALDPGQRRDARQNEEQPGWIAT
jgi:hypothetical protein